MGAGHKFSLMKYPIWCPHCRESLGDKLEAWEAMKPREQHQTHNEQGRSASEVFAAIGIHNACCKKVLRTTNVLIHTLNKYKRPMTHGRPKGVRK